MRVTYFIWLILLLSLISCNNSQDKNLSKHKPGNNELADLNRYFIQKDRERIQNYIERKKLTMKESPSGLWYYIKKEGKGRFFTDKDKISIIFTCSLLDGTECYNSDNTGPKEHILGSSEIEAGLNEGLRLLKPGGEAMFILPPFLAYGLPGDGKSIPSRSVIVYHIKIRE